MGGGAWPFLVGGAICLVNSDNERDSSLLNSWSILKPLRPRRGARYLRVRVFSAVVVVGDVDFNN